MNEGHTYEHPGDFTVTDIFSTDHDAYTAMTEVTVADDGALSLGFLTPVNEGDTFVLNANFTDSNGDTPTLYQVAWGDGQSDTYGTTPDYHGAFPHVYDDANTSGYPVSVTAVSEDGTYSAEGTETIGLLSYGIVAQSDYNTSPDQPLLVDVYFYDGNITDTYAAPDHTFTYSVDWGDGATATYSGPNFSHAYAYDDSTESATNNYDYTVSAWDDEYNAGSDIEQVNVLPPATGDPSIDLNVPSTIQEGQTVTVSAHFSDSAQSTFDQGVGWDAQMGDGTVLGGSGQIGSEPDTYFNNDETYSQAGNYVFTIGAYFIEEQTDGAHYAYTTANITVTEATPTLTVAGDTPAAVTGYDYTLTPTYLDDELGTHTPLHWTVAWGDGTSDYYTEGVDLPDFTHVYKTASTSGTVYHPQVTLTSADLHEPITASTSVTIAQALMQVLQADGTPMDHDAQHTMGAFVSVNDNDDGDNYDSDGNPLADDTQTSLPVADPDLVEVSLNPLPSSVGGSFTLSWDSDLNVWLDNKKTTAVVAGQTTFDATTATAVFIEGTQITAKRGGDLLQELWSRSGAVIPADRAKAMVGKIVGPPLVPSYGTYEYKLQAAVPSMLPVWSATGGTIQAPVPRVAADVTNVFWDSPQGAAGDGWYGTVTYLPFVGFPVRLPVKVFLVTVTEPVFNPGVPFGQNGNLGNGANQPYSVTVASGVPAPAPPAQPGPHPPGLAYSALVTVTGPRKAGANHNDNDGANNIRVGFIQNVVANGYVARGTYLSGKVLTSSAEKSFSNAVLDKDPANSFKIYPWYSKGYFTPNVNKMSTTLSGDDSPATSIPLDSRQDSKVANVLNRNSDLLVQTTIQDTFRLDVCAEAFLNGNPNGANNVFVREATATGGAVGTGWRFNGNGAGKRDGHI